jgi:CheY-like chemotaxis protein
VVQNRLATGRVLVVEDDPSICALITEMIEGVGLATVCVQTDEAAYSAIPTLPAFQAMVLDINLGVGTTGFDVGRFARQIIPDLPIVYVSGDASQVSFRAFGVPGSTFLAKPFTPKELLNALSICGLNGE